VTARNAKMSMLRFPLVLLGVIVQRCHGRLGNDGGDGWSQHNAAPPPLQS
jgi:hypothetical protein